MPAPEVDLARHKAGGRAIGRHPDPARRSVDPRGPEANPDLAVVAPPMSRPSKTFYVRVANKPSTRPWHIEGSEVEVMRCGVVIDLESGEVRAADHRPKRVCAACRAK
jgi:hypothetical protein